LLLFTIQSYTSFRAKVVRLVVGTAQRFNASIIHKIILVDLNVAAFIAFMGANFKVF
jgi:hypothetical protein